MSEVGVTGPPRLAGPAEGAQSASLARFNAPLLTHAARQPDAGGPAVVPPAPAICPRARLRLSIRLRTRPRWRSLTTDAGVGPSRPDLRF